MCVYVVRRTLYIYDKPLLKKKKMMMMAGIGCTHSTLARTPAVGFGGFFMRQQPCRLYNTYSILSIRRSNEKERERERDGGVIIMGVY